MRAEPGQGEDLEAMEREFAYSMRNDRFQLILLPTEQCNFRCTYCYEDFAVGRMRPKIVEGVKRLVDRRLDDLYELRLSWFGGEPLLAADIVEDVSGHVMQAALRSDVRYAGDVTTNGYQLDTAMLHRLVDVGVRDFQVSLDGPEPIHDQTRVRADGRGSYRRIWQNLLGIRDCAEPVTVVLRVHLTPANLPAMPEFLVLIRNTFLPDPRFSVLLKPVERLGGPNDAEIDILDKDSRATTLASLDAIVRGEGEAGGLPEEPVCYAARPNSLVIRANGMLGKCTVSLNHPANNLGRLRPDGTLDVRNDRLHPWLRGWETGDWNALQCPADGFTLDEPTPLQIGPTRYRDA